MNYKEYKKIMNEKGLIENVITVNYLETAKEIKQSMMYVKRYNSFDREVLAFHGINQLDLYKSLEKQKDWYIQKAIDEAWNKEETLERFGKKYYSMMKVAERVAMPEVHRMTEHYKNKCRI